MNPPSLSHQLIAQIQTLVAGNQAKAADVVPQQHRVEPFQASLHITWQFVARSEEHAVAGGQVADRHFGDDIAAFNYHTDQLNLLAAHDTILRAPFVQQMAAKGKDGILEAQQEHRFYSFHPFSVHKPCQYCKGQGHTTCRTCHGRGNTSCTYCHGSGQDNGKPCSHCHQGLSTCHTCSGSGHHTCTHCNGHGVFTITRQLAAFAIPSFQINIAADLKAADLQRFLNRQDLAFCIEKIPFEFSQHAKSTANSHCFTYQGQQILLMQAFSLHGQNYICGAFGTPPYPFIRPTLFDDLFADELDFLLNHVEASNSKIFTVFNRYAKQPVLAQALRNLTDPQGIHNRQNAVAEACQDFISPHMAERLTRALTMVINRVSPTYLKSWWYGIILLLAGFGLLYTEYRAEVLFTTNLSSRILSVTLLLIMVGAFGGILAWLGSSILTRIRHRNVPPDYRPPTLSREPLFLLFKTILLSHLIGILYGFAVTLSFAPSWQGQPFAYLLHKTEYHCLQYRTSQPYLDTVCPLILKTLPNFLEISTSQLINLQEQNYPPQSTEDKIRYIQRQLILAGYPITLDGEFGQQTAQFAKEHLVKHRSKVATTHNIDIIYRQMGGQ